MLTINPYRIKNGLAGWLLISKAEFLFKQVFFSERSLVEKSNDCSLHLQCGLHDFPTNKSENKNQSKSVSWSRNLVCGMVWRAELSWGGCVGVSMSVVRHKALFISFPVHRCEDSSEGSSTAYLSNHHETLSSHPHTPHFTLHSPLPVPLPYPLTAFTQNGAWVWN